jgi:hypothetical protein
MAKWDKPGSGGVLGPPPGGGQGPTPVQTGVLAINPVIGTDPDVAGVMGESNTGPGVLGISIATAGFANMPGSGASDGVQGHSAGNGVHGISTGQTGSGVRGENTAGGYGVWASGQTAGRFDGDVELNGNLKVGSQGDVILNDCAEHFDVIDGESEPGTVMVIGQDGILRPSDNAYDKKVAGVVSGGGDFRPGIILGKQRSESSARVIALFGKVYCKVDAQYSPVEVGDLLTTSPTSGHAMKAEDPSKAFGAVLGKALRPLDGGRGLIPILVTLQ